MSSRYFVATYFRVEKRPSRGGLTTAEISQVKRISAVSEVVEKTNQHPRPLNFNVDGVAPNLCQRGGVETAEISQVRKPTFDTQH